MTTEADKFVWAFMIENGIITTGKWSYYGGHYYSDHSLGKTGIDALRKKVRDIGVDWEKTKQPESHQEQAFTDTFNDPDRVETLLGTLVLKDGSTYLMGCVDDHGFGSYVKKLAQLAEDKERVKRILGE